MIISYTRKINVAAEELDQNIHFQYHSGQSAWVRVCQMCGATRCETLTPVDVWEGTEESPDERCEITGQTLCEKCCLSPDVGGGWYALSLEEKRGLWELVRSDLAFNTAVILDDVHAAQLSLEDKLVLSVAANDIMREAAGIK